MASLDPKSVTPALKTRTSVRVSADAPRVRDTSSSSATNPLQQANNVHTNKTSAVTPLAFGSSASTGREKLESHSSAATHGATVHDNMDSWDISRINKPWEIDQELRRSLPVLARAKRNDRESAADKFLRLSKLPLPAAPSAESRLLDISTPLDRHGSQRSIILTPDTKAKYFGSNAKTECRTIFRKLAAQKYLTNQPLNEFLDDQQACDDRDTTARGARTAITPLALTRRDSEALVEQHEQQQQQQQEQRRPPVLSRLGTINSSMNSLSASTVNLFENNFHQVDRNGLFSRQFTARHKFSALCLEQDLPPCIRLIVRNYFSPEINVSHMAIGDDLACVFAECLHDLPMVTGLNVRNNRLGDKGLRALIDVVVTKRDLFHLDLSENKVDGAAATALATYLGSATCALQSLKLSRADVDDSELAPFAKALHTNRSLQTLELSRNLVGSTEHLNVVRPSIVTGGEALATMLSINYTLTSLDLSWNYLRLGGAVELGKALAFNSGLRELNLAYNAFGNDGAQAIGEALLSNACLEKLNLSNNNIPARGAQAIASAIKVHSKLVSINFDGNPLGATGGRALLHAVANCTDRQLAISLESCNFDVNDADGFDPAESTGSYDLNMDVPYDRAVALELLRVANSKQGCKFLSVIHITGPKTRRNIKLELREVGGTDAHRRLLKTASILSDATADDRARKTYKMDRASLIELFYELDADDSGFVDALELTRGMRQLGLSFRDDDVSRYIAQYDLDGTGTIERDEFVELMSTFRLGDGHVARCCFDVETNAPFAIPTDGRLVLDFVDLHVSTDDDSAHSHAGVERLIENISMSKNKTQMLAMAKSGLYFKANEAQLLLESVADVFEVTQAVTTLLPNMVDAKHAQELIEHNLDASQRVRLQHLMGHALQPMLGLATGHYRLDLGNDTDRLTLKKLIENSNRTAFLRKRAGLKDTSQHGNYHGFRNETLNSKPLVLEPQFLDKLPKFGMLEFDYVQLGRTPAHPISTKRLEQIIQMCQLEQMGPSMGVRTKVTAAPLSTTKDTRSNNKRSATDKTQSRAVATSPFPPLRVFTRALYSELESMKSVRSYIKFGDGWNRVVELTGSIASTALASDAHSARATTIEVANATMQLDDHLTADRDDLDRPAAASTTTAATDSEVGTNEPQPPALRRVATDSDNSAAMLIQRDGKATCTARRLLFNLQWLLTMRWVSAQQAVRLLSVWPEAFEASRIDLVCVLFDRLADLHNFNGILSALTDAEAAQCFYRFGWLNIWTPLLVDNYYEMNLSIAEEREVAKCLVRLAIDEPGENWQRETFGWSRDELIPGWELNMSWLKDGGFPEKGYLCLEYYSGADKGCGPVWPTRRELASTTLCGLPEDDIGELIAYVDALSRMPGGLRRV